MIDWSNLLFNSLWILGCSLALAVLSYASWRASLEGDKFRARLAGRNSQKWLSIAGMLFCAGLAGTSGPIWQVFFWGALGVVFLAQWVVLLLGK